MKPTRNNIFVTEVEAKTTTESGIILTGAVDKAIKPAKVLAIGPDVHSTRVGDTVYLKWSEGTPITHEGTKGAILAEESLLAVL